MGALSYIHETPQEAALRVAADLCRRILADEPRIGWDEISPGQVLKVGGEWLTVCLVNHGDQSLGLVSDAGRFSRYPVNEGETFLAMGF